MKILFVYTRETPQSPVKPLVDLEAIQFGISHISSYLKAHGHETRLLVMTRSDDLAVADRLLGEFDPQVVCFTAVASEYLFVRKIAEHVRGRDARRYLVLGGVHASLRPDDSMLDVFDALCIGEGEQPMLELVGQLAGGTAPSGIANLWIRQGGQIEKNPTRDFMADLDALPFADREMWMEWIDLERSPMRPSLLLGRGCPFPCTYCCNHSLRKLAHGKYVRLRSPANTVAEIEALVERMPQIREIYFEVETFGADIAWARALCDALVRFNAGRRSPLSFGANLRITPALKPQLDDLFAALRAANFRFLNIGLESGSPRLREEVLRRRYVNEDVVEAVAKARQYGLDVIFFNLIGLPTETLDDLRQTIQLNAVCRPDYHYLSIFYPYPGTDLHALCERSGWLPRDLLATTQERVRAALDYPTLSRGQIEKAFIWFDAYAFPNRSRAWHVDHLWHMYKLVYGRPLVVLGAMTRDVFWPPLRLVRGAPEIGLYLALLRHLAGKVRRRLVEQGRRCPSLARRVAAAVVRRLRRPPAAEEPLASSCHSESQAAPRLPR